MEQTKKTAQQGVVKARVWAEIAQVKLKVTQAEEGAKSVRLPDSSDQLRMKMTSFNCFHLTGI